jgi:hypothetical protein
VNIDPTRLRFKDWKEIEGLTGKTMGWFVAEFQNGMGNLSADDFEVVAWVTAKRDNPAFTREDASELSPSDLTGGDDPKAAAAA